ncbi:hypothetical protein F4X10_19040 [Candidatus Poribacteria bacterium]|nr:hypothetical protein [Candidatus Poribacteria bacterium]
MRTFTFISIAFVLLIGVGVIYVQWETKNFVESLPEPLSTSDPTPETQQDSSVAVPDTVNNTRQPLPEDESSDVSFENAGEVNEGDASSRETVNTAVPVEENIGPQDDDFNWQNDDVQSLGHPLQIDPWQSAEDRKAHRRAGPNITPEALRSQLVERFGDIPEVHTFVELDQKQNQRQPLTLDEYILYNESMNHLFPNKKTEQAIKMLKQMQQMRAAGVPVTILNPED